MASFREARIALLDAYMDGLLDDDEFLVLWQAHKSKNPEFPYEEHGRFSFDELDEAECKAEFRFEKRDLPVLVNVLGIPNQFTCSQRTVSVLLSKCDFSLPVRRRPPLPSWCLRSLKFLHEDMPLE